MRARNTRCLSLWDAVAIVQLTLLSILLTVQFWHWDFDDGFIVYRYVENIASGLGWVYNPGEHYNASTSALNTVLTLILTLLGMSPLAAAHLVGGFGLWLMSISVYAIFRRDTTNWFSAGVASVCCIMMANNFTWGLESHLFFGLLGLYIALEVYGYTLWFVLGLLVLARPDALILVCLRVALALWQRNIPVKGVAIVLLTIAPWALFSVWSFGNVFPATLQQKRWQGSSGFWGTGWIFLQGLSGYIRGETFRHLSGVTWAPVLLTAPLVLVPQGLLYVSLRRNRVTLMFFYVAAMLSAYTLLNVPNYHWYYAGVVLVTFVFAGFGALFITEQLSIKLPRFMNGTLVALLLIGTGWKLSGAKNDQSDLRTSVYRNLTDQILAKTPAGDSIAAVEVGVFGYYSKRPMVDIVGLTTPYGEFITGANSDRLFNELKPSVIVMHEPLMLHEESVYGDPLFASNYRLAGVVTIPGYPELSFFVRQARTSTPAMQDLARTRLHHITEVGPNSFVVRPGDPWIEYKAPQPVEIATPALALTYSLSNPNLPPGTPVRARVYVASAGQAYSEERAYPAMLRTGANNQATIQLVTPGSGQGKPNPFQSIRFDVIQSTTLVDDSTFEVSSIGVVGLK